MKSQKEIPAPSTRQHVIRGIRFQNAAQIEMIKRAAAHRGWTFNAFVVRVAQAMAERELELPVSAEFELPIERALTSASEAAA